MTDEEIISMDDDDLMLTTLDNPWNPKVNYEQWRIWDAENGYHTEELLARLTVIPPTVDVDDEYTIRALTNEAVDELLEHDVLGVYTLV